MTAVPANRYVIYFLLAIVGLAVDLATKWWAFSALGMPGENPPYWLVDGLVGLETSLNEGALFGIGQGQVALFATLSGVALCGVLYWLFVVGAASDRLLTVALGMITGGIFGNLYDRLGLHGLTWSALLKPTSAGERVYAVRDFILLQASPEWRWPNFNVADSLLVCGVGLLLWHSTFNSVDQAAPKNSAAPAPADLSRAAH